jgi:hypothetical protein
MTGEVAIWQATVMAKKQSPKKLWHAKSLVWQCNQTHPKHVISRSANGSKIFLKCQHNANLKNNKHVLGKTIPIVHGYYNQ